MSALALNFAILYPGVDRRSRREVAAVAEGGIREPIMDGVNGLLVPYEAGAMAGAIPKLIRDRDYAERLGKNGSQIVAEQWTLDAAIERLEVRLADAIAGSRSTGS
jgi:glycosyltransferase involved in cell wall biosynthesis